MNKSKILKICLYFIFLFFSFLNVTKGQGKGNNILPVELQYFYGELQDSIVFLFWGTATEVNNYGFEVQRSLDTLDSEWENIGFVMGHGNSNSPKDYSFIDESLPDTDNIFYRLKQIDNTGDFKYSWIVSVSIVNGAEKDCGEIIPKSFSVTNFPNPFGKRNGERTTVLIKLIETRNIHLAVFNSLGQTVKNIYAGTLSKGKHFYNLDFSTKTSGNYFLSLKIGNKIFIHKMLFLK